MKKGGKNEWRRPEVKQRALERMRTAPNISALAKTLGIPRRTLYSWWDKEAANQEGRRKVEWQTKEQELERQIVHLKEALAETTLDLSFFRGALQKIEERRPARSAVVAPASTTKSGK
jgi:transposase-like protein